MQEWGDCIKPSVQDYQLRLGFGRAALTKHGINLSVSLKILSDHFCKIEVPVVSPAGKYSDYCSEVPKDLEIFWINFITHPLYLMDGHSSKDEQTVASCSAISSIWFGFHCPKNDFMDKLWSSVKAWKDMFLVFHALRKNVLVYHEMSHVSFLPDHQLGSRINWFPSMFQYIFWPLNLPTVGIDCRDKLQKITYKPFHHLEPN